MKLVNLCVIFYADNKNLHTKLEEGKTKDVFIGKKLISNWTTRLHELLGFTQTVPNVYRQLSEFNGAVCNDSTYKTVAIFRVNKAQKENGRVSTQYVAILRSAVTKALMRSVLSAGMWLRAAWHNSTLHAWHTSTVPAWHNSTVPVWHNSTVPAWHNSTVPAWHNSTVPTCTRLHGVTCQLTSIPLPWLLRVMPINSNHIQLTP